MLTQASPDLLKYRDILPYSESLVAVSGMATSKGLVTTIRCPPTNADNANQSSPCKALTMMNLVRILMSVVRIDVVKRR